MKPQKQNSRDTNRTIWRMAGSVARIQGQTLEECPELRRGERDTYGAWLMEQWRDGWREQDEKIRQLSLFEERV